LAPPPAPLSQGSPARGGVLCLFVRRDSRPLAGLPALGTSIVRSFIASFSAPHHHRSRRHPPDWRRSRPIVVHAHLSRCLSLRFGQPDQFSRFGSLRQGAACVASGVFRHFHPPLSRGPHFYRTRLTVSSMCGERTGRIRFIGFFRTAPAARETIAMPKVPCQGKSGAIVTVRCSASSRGQNLLNGDRRRPARIAVCFPILPVFTSIRLQSVLGPISFEEQSSYEADHRHYRRPPHG
jgi:hypothetical protein